MIPIQIIRENPDLVVERLLVKNFKADEIVKNIIDIDSRRRSTQNKTDSTQNEINTISREIGNLYKAGKADEANSLKEKTSVLKEDIKKLNQELSELENEQNELLVSLPNIPHSSVKKGNGADDNEIIFQKSEIETPEWFVPHWDLAVKHNLIDFETGTKITGAGFPVYTDKGAKLQRALINYFLDKATENGYLEVQVPYMVNEESAYATGQLPDKDGQMYHATVDNFYLIPTAEVPVTNIYRNMILNADEMPIKNCAYSACFRREAGSYGKDVRGLNRLHQFDKVEIVQIANPEKSYEVLEEMRNYVASIIEELELPYRILRLCGGDISFTSALTYDFEVYSKAQKRWLEVSSVSNFESFQTNRLKLRFRNAEGKTELCHSLNGSALALPRMMASIIENYQTEDGIIIPKVLQKYTGFDKI